MVLDLIIQPTNVPRENWIPVFEIGRCFHLVNCPTFIRIVFRVVIDCHETCFRHNVRWLENECKHRSAYKMHREETDQPLPPGNVHYQHWNQSNGNVVQRFCNNQEGHCFFERNVL